MHRQLADQLPADDGRRGLVLSASKELEPGSRAMLLVADGLFRLDVVLSGDTIRTVVRNLSSSSLEMNGTQSTATATNVAFGEVESYQPGRAAISFALGTAQDRVAVSVTIATLRIADRGTIRVMAQAIVRQAPDSA